MIGIRMIVAPLVLMVFAACAHAATNTNAVASAKAPVPLRIGHIVFEGGDGSSIEKAVVIKNAKNEQEGVGAESQWIRKIHPGWSKGRQAELEDSGRNYDRIEYTTPGGEKETIFFDITDFFGKF